MTAVAAGAQRFAEATCFPRMSVVGGGVVVEGGLDSSITASFPSSGDGTANIGTKGWGGFANNASGSTQFMQAYAICAEPESVSASSLSAANAKRLPK